MILTDRFVYIHNPGTGGTFVTKAVKMVYRKGGLGPVVDTNKHGGCREIPTSHRHLPIVSTIRNPFDRYVAFYKYGWWRKHEMPGIGLSEIRELYPMYPNIDFPDFVELVTEHFAETKFEQVAARHRPGYFSERFVDMFFRDPRVVWEGFGPEYVQAGEYKADMYPVRFLGTEWLNTDLEAFLLDVGISQELATRVRRMDKVAPPRVRLSLGDLLLRNRPRRSESDWSRFYTPELKARVRMREWLLFEVFPMFDV